jgi:hypothetical protein
MRLTNPLLNRAKGSVDDGAGSGVLPQLESAGSKPPFSAFGVSINAFRHRKLVFTLYFGWLRNVQGGKGVGWKAPAEPERKLPPREPGVDQVDAAKRLSQGLSVKEVKHSVRQRLTAENAISTRYSAAVVLDKQAQIDPQAPPRPTAVIRQQMFHFDAEYREQMLLPTQGGGLAPSALGGGGGSMYGAGFDTQGSFVDDGRSLNGGRSIAGARSNSVRRTGMNVITPTPTLVARDQSAPVLLNGRQIPVISNPQPTVLPHRYVPPQKKPYGIYKDYDYSV